MKNLKKHIAKKLKSAVGESLAEVLIALLIAALAMVMLATAISSTARIVTRSKATMKNYYDGNNALDAYVSAGENITEVTDVTISFDGVRLTDPEGTDVDSQTFSVLAFENKKSPKVPVISYKLSS